MKNLTLICFLSFIFALRINAEPKIEYISVLFRHGERAPDYNEYANDPYRYSTYSPEGNGELTNIGRMREYRLGEKLRELYDDFIGDTYNSSVIHARTTDWDRIKMSCQLVMAALFKPKNHQIWNRNLNWQPTVIDSVPGFLDALMFPQDCPLYLEEYSKSENSTEVKKIFNEFSDFRKKLTKLAGQPIKSFFDIYRVYHALTLEAALNLTLPKWTEKYFPNGLLLKGTILYYETVSWTTKLKRLNGGMLLRNITENMLDVISNKTEIKKKMYLYSGNERNLAAFLITLGVYDQQVPEFSSAVILELLSECGEYYVKVRYYKGIPEETITLKIPGCDELCPFENFLKIMEPVIPEENELICMKEPLKLLIQKTYDKLSRI